MCVCVTKNYTAAKSINFIFQHDQIDEYRVLKVLFFEVRN